MGSEVATLVPRSVQCRDTVLSTLADMTKTAQESSLTGIAIAAVDAEGHSYFLWAGGENYSLLLGAIERLKKRVLDESES